MTTPTPPLWTTAATVSDPFLRRHDTPVPLVQGQCAPGPGLADIRAADLRRRAIDRLIAMNIRHTETAWQRRRRDPLEPHGLALLYIQPDPAGLHPYQHRLTAATRLWLHDGHRFDVHQRMFRFYKDVAAEIRSRIDVRAYTDRCDDTMADDAVYVGLGVSSLDTSTGTWQDLVATASTSTTDTRPAHLWGRDTTPHSRPSPQARMRVDDHHDIPGSFRIILTDGTLIVGERRGRPDFDHRIVRATATLDFAPHHSPYPWAMVTREDLHTDAYHTEVLRWMAQLHDLCWQADTARLDAQRSDHRRSPGHR